MVNDETSIIKAKFEDIQNVCVKKIVKKISEEIQLPVINSKSKVMEQLSLSHGDPGLILLFSRINNSQMVALLEKRIISNLNKVNIDLSLFSGLSGIGFSFLYSWQIFGKNDQLVKQVDRIIITNLNQIISKSLKKPFASCSFDVIQGLSGIGQYLLSVRVSGVDQNEDISNELRLVINALEKISDSKKIGYKYWWISRENQFLKEEREIYPEGNYNLGMAHGILGPLSLLLLVAKHKLLKKDDQKYLSMWTNELLSFARNVDGKIVFWPRESSSSKEVYPGKEFIKRNGWCYGESIICYVLFLAGDVLNSINIEKKAKKILEQILNADNKELSSPILCHGKAGLLLILSQIKKEYYSQIDIDNEIKKLIREILDAYSNDYKFGFVDTSEPVIPGYQIVKDKAGLLEGTVGILLALMDHLCPRQKVIIPWYTVFMLN